MMSTTNPGRTQAPMTEAGIILPITALIIVILMVFAAFAVDLGAAWAERRQDQTAADAAAMAGAIEYVRSNPSDADVLALVKDYVERNIGYPTTGAGWNLCPPQTDGFAALAGNNCVGLKQSSTESSDVLLKVRIPDQQVETAFARIIGIDTIAVSAEATARIEQHLGVKGALPFVLPLDAGTEYCLGTPPPGQLRDVCEKQASGFYGTINSPWLGAAEDPWGTPRKCSGGGADIVASNAAIGIDHFLGIAPVGSNPADHPDECATVDNGLVPKSIKADQGGLNQVAPGLTGPDTYGSLGLPSRLRQSGGNPAAPDPWRDFPTKGGGAPLDNVGLWEYLIHPDSPVNDACRSELFADDVVGTQLTLNMVDCLNKGTVKFSDSLLKSPRFAIVPQIDLNQVDLGDISPSKPTNIVKFIPVYIQSTWFNCSAGECVQFLPDNLVVPDKREIFDPGEGTAPGCSGDAEDPDSCKNKDATLEGLSAFVFDNEAWLPEAFDNQFNDPNAYNVYLHR